MKTLLTILFTCTIMYSYGQSEKKMESYLQNNWVSVASIYDNDTTLNSSQKLILGENGELISKMDGLKGNGTWKYLDESNSLELTMVMGDYSQAFPIKIGVSSDQMLSLVFPMRGKLKTLLFVEEGSGIVIEIEEVSEKSLEDTQGEGDTNKTADLGYSPTGKVIEHVDFNLEFLVRADGSSRSAKDVGIVYLLEETDGAQKVVIIRGHNGMPEDWTVVDKIDEYGQIYYDCNLKYDYQKGEKIEVNTKARVKFTSPNVFFNFEDGRIIKFTIVQD